MSEIMIRVLGEEDWQQYREVRLAALSESPQSFTASYKDEADQDEAFWRDRMTRSVRFVAERDGAAVGVVSLGHDDEDPQVGEIFGLYVTPKARTTGVSWRLVQAAAEQAHRDGMRQLQYWVGTENARAIAFAANFGFRPAGERRDTRVDSVEDGDQEVAMVLSLSADPGSVPNPTRGRVAPAEGPLR
jgi:RimJ/RimL family protein N-acetyltransferase